MNEPVETSTRDCGKCSYCAPAPSDITHFHRWAANRCERPITVTVERDVKMTENPSIAAMKTLALVDKIEERVNATTDGPWYRRYSDVVCLQPDPRDDGYDDPRNLRIMQGPDHLDKKDRQGIANAEFFAHSKADVLLLIALVRRASEQIANVRSLTADIGGSDNFLNVVIARHLRQALGDEPMPIFEADGEKDEEDFDEVSKPPYNFD